MDSVWRASWARERVPASVDRVGWLRRKAAWSSGVEMASHWVLNSLAPKEMGGYPSICRMAL